MFRVFGMLIASALLSATVWSQEAEAPTEKVIVYPMEAIVDSARMSHAQFKQRYPGIDITSFGLTDEGWYIRYRHENLVYLFGPSSDLEYTRHYKAIIEQVRLSVVLKNPKLSSSKLEIIRFDFYGSGPTSVPDENPYLIPELRDKQSS